MNHHGRYRHRLPATAALLAILTTSALATESLVSRSYLTGTFTNQVEQLTEQRLKTAAVSNSNNFNNSNSNFIFSTFPSVSASTSSNWQEMLLNATDRVQCPIGSSVFILDGDLQADSTGTIIDITTGSVIKDGEILTQNHRYLIAETSQASLTIRSKTAVIHTQGGCTVQYSQNSHRTDYFAIATALKTLHLFQGSNIGFGQGYELQAAPTRLQALIMFLRVMGEEQNALAYTGTTPFTDIAPGSKGEKYVGYAYSKGYTKGYSAHTFQPGQNVTAAQYLEFLLRALGYRAVNGSGSTLDHALDEALSIGMITAAEQQSLLSSPFLRADLAYISYYALDTPMADSPDQSEQTLHDILLSRQIFTETESNQARALVPGSR